MPTVHRVLEGEGTTAIADREGFFDQTLWSFPDNRALRARRSNLNALLPGDELVIPDKRLQELERPTGARHRFRRRGVPAKYRVQLVSQGKALAGLPFVLTVDDAVVISGRTDAEGVVEGYVPTGSRRGVLRVERTPHARDIVVTIELGRVDPIEETCGVQKRLTNLGYDCGPPDGTLNDRTIAALLAFQRRHGLDATGVIDGPTRARVARLHDTRAVEEPAPAPGGTTM